MGASHWPVEVKPGPGASGPQRFTWRISECLHFRPLPTRKLFLKKCNYCEGLSPRGALTLTSTSAKELVFRQEFCLTLPHPFSRILRYKGEKKKKEFLKIHRVRKDFRSPSLMTHLMSQCQPGQDQPQLEYPQWWNFFPSKACFTCQQLWWLEFSPWARISLSITRFDSQGTKEQLQALSFLAAFPKV